MKSVRKATTASATIHDIDLGEGVHPLCLRIGEMEHLEEITGDPIAAIYARLGGNGWKVGDVRTVIRLALVGGGMPPYEASGMVNRLITEGYLAVYATVAFSCLIAALSGYEDPSSGEPEAPTTEE